MNGLRGLEGARALAGACALLYVPVCYSRKCGAVFPCALY
mgnify:CR=1 FL=1